MRGDTLGHRGEIERAIDVEEFQAEELAVCRDLLAQKQIARDQVLTGTSEIAHRCSGEFFPTSYRGALKFFSRE